MQVQTENTPSPGEGLTFEKVWASIVSVKLRVKNVPREQFLPVFG